MPYQVKKTLISLITSLIIFVSYTTQILPQIGVQTEPKYWATVMLVYIGIGVVVMIILHIAFHIFLSVSIAIKERNKDSKSIEKSLNVEMVEDEMTKLIDLKSIQVGYSLTGIGFVTGLIYLALGYSIVLTLNIIFIASLLGGIIEGITNIYLNLKGVRNG